ncbi:MAG: Gfo/Idh/MocA family oxidoreductase [Acidobacteria bacterium]|nr:Gfo/Idh/MocA family oxidoreductase [Acidobacteriota bacterium]
MPTRRNFLAASAAMPAALAQTTRPNDKIRIALIGAGGMGSGDVNSALSTGLAELVAVADIYDGRLTRAKELWGGHIQTTRDYREILAKKDIDAVIVGTPDHWHSRISIDAMNAGKDVYCEKPMVQKVDDGHLVIDAAKKTNRIIQVGSQRVSSVIYDKARQLLAAGAIGELNLVEAWWDRNSAIGAWQYSVPPDASPANIDWDRFLGSAPKRPFEPVRLFRWRNYQDYGTGVAGDLFVHLFSGLHFITGVEGPERVFATGGLRFWKDGRDVPDVMMGLYDYPAQNRMPAFNLALRVNFVNGAGETSGFRFVGSEGIMTVGSGVTIAKVNRETEPGYTIGTFPAKVQEEFLKQYREKYPPQKPTADGMMPQGEDVYRAPRNYSDHLDHHRNFLTAVKSRKPVVEDALFGLRAAGPALLSNRSYFEKKTLFWDASKAQVKG